MRLWPRSTKQAAEETVPLATAIADDVWAQRHPVVDPEPTPTPTPTPTRAERRRLERETSTPTRQCFRCGFGAVKGVPNSNLVRAKDLDGAECWSHASPVVCAGYVRAITSQARESVKEAGSDFLRITRARISGWFRYHFHRLTTFLVSDGGAGMNPVGGTPQRIRVNTQRNPR